MRDFLEMLAGLVVLGIGIGMTVGVPTVMVVGILHWFQC